MEGGVVCKIIITVTVALTGAHMAVVAPLASAAVSTSMNTIAAASRAAKEYDAKVEEKKQQSA